MKKNLTSISLLLLLGASGMQAQVATEADGKLDPAALRLIESVRHERNGRADGTAESLRHGFIILSSQPDATVEAIQSGGGTARIIDAGTLTATMTTSEAQIIALRPEVRRIHASLEAQPTMDKARVTTHVDEVHDGTGLETPFTGRGVVVGIIDLGFQFNHPAFRSATGSNRIKAIWEKGNSAPTSQLPVIGHDGRRDIDHGTHVTGIAAGSRHGDCPYYGIATEADLVMISTGLTSNCILDGASYIKEYARSVGKPWVINMSFGQQIGPHDGSQPYDQAMSHLTGPGGLMAAAMGNWQAQKAHVKHTFSATDTLRSVSFLKTGEKAHFTLWGNATDSLHHMNVTPYVLNTATGVKEYKNDAFWKSCLYFYTEINPYNHKERYDVNLTLATMRAALGLSGEEAERYTFGIDIATRTKQDAEAGISFHGWTSHDGAEITKYSYYDLIGDNEYMVAEAAATIPAAIAVGAYNNKKSFVSAYDGKPRSYAYNEGAMSDYSDFGPYLGEDQKPTITAPGSTIIAPIGRHVDNFDLNNWAITAAVNVGGSLLADYSKATVTNNHFYGVKSGTSMATPVVTGILALWLEAYPNLTPEQAKEVLHTTAIKDTYTGRKDWDKKWGYGKIDAYAGLKEVLRLAETDGINDCMNTAAPVTLSKGTDAWRILFNNDESFADIALYSLDGRPVSRRHLLAPHRGTEHTVDLNGLPAGIYLLRIATTGSVMTRRVMVK